MLNLFLKAALQPWVEAFPEAEGGVPSGACAHLSLHNLPANGISCESLCEGFPEEHFRLRSST